jgi:hypothetical protein
LAGNQRGSEEGIRKSAPNKEDALSYTREMRSETEVMLGNFQKPNPTQQFTQNGGARNTQWGGSSSSSSNVLE